MMDDAAETESKPNSPISERAILFILAAVQFSTIVDFMIVMPLGPQLMRTLAISPSQFGIIVSSYTFAAGLAGFVAATVVDRFARRTSFMVLYSGFLIGTFLCAIAPTYSALVAARVLTGAFGGIIGGITMAIIGDVFPENRRGRATGSLMTGFAFASVAGVPLGLYIGTNYGWHMPFIALAISGMPLLIIVRSALPPLDSHLSRASTPMIGSLKQVFFNANHVAAFLLITMLMIGSFTVFPYLSAYLVGNVGMTEAQLPLVYIAGGALTLLAAPRVGRIADRFGKLKVYIAIAPLSALFLLVITHLPPVHWAIAVISFGCLMVCNVGRMIPAMAMVTSCVAPERRGAFLSANSSIQHIASGVGSSIGGFIVTQSDTGELKHFGMVGWIAAIATILSIALATRIKPAIGKPIAAESICLPAAAEAAVDAGETLAIGSGTKS